MEASGLKIDYTFLFISKKGIKLYMWNIIKIKNKQYMYISFVRSIPIKPGQRLDLYMKQALDLIKLSNLEMLAFSVKCFMVNMQPLLRYDFILAYVVNIYHLIVIPLKYSITHIVF